MIERRIFMGSGTWREKDWEEYKKKRGYSKSATVRDMYRAVTVKPELEPRGVSFREACDSTEHPKSTPIILALDVTGSMGCVLEVIAKKLNTLITEIYHRKPVTDPQVMIMAFGDVECDRHPLQVSQFESDIRIAEQLNDIYFERGGGGNAGESYTFPWYFASRHTKLDCYDKRNKKGFLFTIGDEPYLENLSKEAIYKFLGDEIEGDLGAEVLLQEVSRQYEVYHLMIEEGAGMRNYPNVIDVWTGLMGQRAMRISDCQKIPEIIVSILEVAGGKEAKKVINSWDSQTALAVQEAITGLKENMQNEDFIEF